MPNVWKKLFIVATILLVTCTAFCGSFWYQLDDTKKQLDDTKAQLVNTRVELDTSREQLAETKTLLDNTEAQLADTEAQLADTEAQLVDTKVQLDTTETELNVTNNQLVTITAQLHSTKNELASTQSYLDTEKNENSQMVNQYSSIRDQIHVRLGLTPQDEQSFITPDNLSVSAKVQEITGGYSENVSEYWRDFELLYRWVANNISYSYDSYIPFLPETMSGELSWSKECWRTPEETLEDETGDCEDMAVLLASMLRGYNEGRYRVWVIIIHSNVPEVPGHAAVAFPVAGGKLTILDPAGNYYTGYLYGTLRSESTSVAVNQWLSYWQNDIPGAEIVTAFSETDHQQFPSTAEFISWTEE
ncbi:MAG: hypothetical protein ISS55_01635 [Dehalococcoidales bacterium]|nr:hypothetical protein [Dehalococcoidales bacterium]